MNCQELRQRVSEMPHGPHGEDLSASQLQHLANCPACSAFLTKDQELESHIRGALKQVEVPERVTHGIHQNMTHSSSPGVPWLQWASGSTVALAALLLLFFLPGGGSFASMDDMGQLAIADHESHLGRACSKGLPEDLAAWGKETIGVAITAPRLPFKGGKLIAVSKCILGDCATAHLTYSRDGKRFSVFIIPEKEADFALHRDRNYTLQFQGYEVTIWKTGNQIYAMVS